MTAFKIPYAQLNPATFHYIIEEFVIRDGTDYGKIEFSLEPKNFQALGQLKTEKVVIVFDYEPETKTFKAVQFCN